MLEAGWERGRLRLLLGAFNDIFVNEEANDTAADFCAPRSARSSRTRRRRAAVPTDHPFGTKRACSTPSYFETYNRDNVTWSTCAARRSRRSPSTGVRTSDGEYALDAIVFATGFDAMTGAAEPRSTSAGAAAQPLREKWAAGRAPISGCRAPGFPTCS